MGISVSTALEIFTNPSDLEISIGQGKGGGKFSIFISRGPGHDFKILISSQPFAESMEAAVVATGEILESIRKVATNTFGDKDNPISQILNPDGQEVEQSKVLNSELIQRILEKLRRHQRAGTYEMLAVAG
mgnify:FL=1